MSAAQGTDAPSRIRCGAGFFRRPDRALIQVSGSDRVRWLQGMVSNDVAVLVPGLERSGCYALLLTPQGRILADLHVFERGDHYWLESARSARDTLLERLDAFIIADDVTLGDHTDAWERASLEGPRAVEWFAGWAEQPLDALQRHCGVDVGTPVGAAFVARWGACLDDGLQLFLPTASIDGVLADLREVAARADGECVEGDPSDFERLRVESGIPQFGSELGPDVLPAEVGLIGEAVSLSKGCYTGQEVVARMESRGALSHRLLGVRFDANAAAPPTGTALEVAGKVVGELTSVVASDDSALGLAFVRKAHAEPGGVVRVGDAEATLFAIPPEPAS
ncbi:MAG: hypothetical protein AAF430_07490 [Myxococcota bacterium]